MNRDLSRPVVFPFVASVEYLRVTPDNRPLEAGNTPPTEGPHMALRDILSGLTRRFTPVKLVLLKIPPFDSHCNRSLPGT